MDITMAGLAAVGGVVLNQLLNYGKEMFDKGKAAQRVDHIEAHKAAVDATVKELKEDMDKKFDDMHQRLSRHQRDYLETLTRFSDKLGGVEKSLSKIEGTMDAINMIAQQIVRERK